jgi:(p)ppGpp synthase/HD superfamily hydrolase
MMTFEETLEFIKGAHAGQTYGDQPYWTHPLQVANVLYRELNGHGDEILAALLHDVVEDTEYSLSDLSSIGFNEETLEIVDLLTKQPGSYEENIQRIIDSGNKSAMRVKLADNMVNNSGDKSHMSQERRDRLNKKYKMSMTMLQNALES